MKTIVFQIQHQVIGTSSAEKIFHELNKLLELRSENDIDLNVEKSEKVLVSWKDFFLTGLDILKKEILGELENAEYNDLEDMVYIMQLTYNEIIDILDLKYISSKKTGYGLPPGLDEITNIDTILKHISPKNMKVTITIVDIRLKSNLKRNQTLYVTKKSIFLYDIRVCSILFWRIGWYSWFHSIDSRKLQKR